MLKSSVMLLVGAALSFSQATAPKPPPKPKPDTWERSKECAAQAEKVVAERNALTAQFGSSIAGWENHYSPKCNRCFLSLYYLGGKDQGPASTALLDAFERTGVASSSSNITSWIGRYCRSEEKRDPNCEEEMRRGLGHICSIEKEDADCAKAEAFISEHMKN